MKIQVADPNDPRLALGLARDTAWDRLQKLREVCGCEGGATCATCAVATSEHARLAMEYQSLYAPKQWTVHTNDTWCSLPIAEWAWQGDAAEWER